MARYKWGSPYDWLSEKAQGWDAEQLHSALMDFARDAGSDEIQDRYQSDMEEDGYFQDQDITDKLSRESCVELLEEICIQCYDHETVEELRSAVQSNIEDGTLSYDDVAAKAEDDKP